MSANGRLADVERIAREYGRLRLAVAFTDGIEGEAAKRITGSWNRTDPLPGEKFAAGYVSARCKSKNPAIVLAPSGLLGIDIDGPEGAARFAEVVGDLPTTVTVDTGKGTHLYFRPPEGVRGVAGVEFGKEGGITPSAGRYFVCPPAQHKDGGVYRFREGRAPWDVEIAGLPRETLDAILRAAGTSRKEATAAEPGAAIPEGRRNEALFTEGCALRRHGASEEAILAALIVENAARCRPPLPDDEVEAIAKSAAAYAPGDDVGGAARSGTDGPRELTDAGNADRLRDRHGADLRYCHPWHAWLVWDGTRWRRDDTAEATRRAIDTARAIHAEAAAAEKLDAQKAIGQWARTSQSAARLAAMLQIGSAVGGVPILPADLDRDPWLLNVENGTLDLRTGALREHRRADLITKIAPVRWSPTATAPFWAACLERWLPDPDVRALVQRIAGAALTGTSTSTSHLFFFYGGGQNGKSALCGTLLSLLGKYAIQAAPDVLLAKRDGSVPCDVAELAGRRLALTIEIEDGRRMAESVVKTLTGGDRQKARFMRENFFEFEPTATVILAANHKPEIRAGGLAIWRRIVLVPFTVKIPDTEMIERHVLDERLAAERAGILRWAVDGCLAWQRDGLAPPAAVKAATEEYRAEEDALGTWLEECCERGPGRAALAGDLWASWSAWAANAGVPVGTQTGFGRKLTELGLEAVRLPGGDRARTREGIALRRPEDDR